MRYFFLIYGSVPHIISLPVLPPDLPGGSDYKTSKNLLFFQSFLGKCVCVVDKSPVYGRVLVADLVCSVDRVLL